MRCLSARWNRLALTLGLGLFGASSSTVSAQEWADLQITFVYDSEVVPERKPVAMDKDPVCVQAWGNTKPLSEEMIVDAATKGIKNIALYPDKKKSGLEAGDVHPSLAKPKAEPITLDNNKCVFVPHVAVARKGETVKVLNSDQTAHNANFSFFNNAAVNPLIPVGAFKNILLTESETAPTPVDCNVHPWMRAYLIVSDFPYANVSDEKGVLKIEKLPANKKITFKVWHENQNKSITNVNFGGAATELSKGLLEVTLKPGMNDLGPMKIKPDQFKQ